MRPSTGDIVESRGSLFMRRCRFDVASAVSEIPVIAHRASGDESPLITDEVMIQIMSQTYSYKVCCKNCSNYIIIFDIITSMRS